MGSDSVKHQDKNVVDILIYQKPVGFDMTFSATLVVSGKTMIVICRAQTLPVCKMLNNLKQLGRVSVLLFSKLKVTLKLVRELYIIFQERPSNLPWLNMPLQNCRMRFCAPR